MITSVLATGAVANADTVDVVVNPDDYVTFLGIKDKDGELIGDGGVIVPRIQENGRYTNLAYSIELEITDDDTSAPLDQVAICLYDENQVDTPTKISNDCGKGYNRDGDNNVNNASNSGLTGSPYSSMNATYWPGSTVNNKIIGLSPGGYHQWHGDTEAGGSEITVSGDTHRLSLKFKVSDLAVNSSGWKVRVVAQYRDTTSPYAVTEVEAFSSETYEVAYFGQITTDSRGQVDFGNVIQEDQVEKGPIDTGNYRGNNKSDITLAADDAFVGDTTLAFGADHENLGTNEFAISCGPMNGSQLGNQVFLTEADTAVRFMTQLTDNPSFGVTTSPDNHGLLGQDGYIEADDHGCKLYVGDVPTGSYSNTMTLGITKYLPPQT